VYQGLKNKRRGGRVKKKIRANTVLRMRVCRKAKKRRQSLLERRERRESESITTQEKERGTDDYVGKRILNFRKG